MQITLDLPHVFNPDTSSVDNAYALRPLLDCLIAINTAYLRNHKPAPLYSSGVVYGRTTVWDSIPALYARGYGDCKSLTAALVAEYRLKGVECWPCFRFNPRANTEILVRDFHILVQTRNGYEDPSKVLGMGANEVAPMTSLAGDDLETDKLTRFLRKLGL